MSECDHGRDKPDDVVLNDDNKRRVLDDLVASVEQHCTKWLEAADPATTIKEFVKGTTLLEVLPIPSGDDGDSQTTAFLSSILNETSSGTSRSRILLHLETIKGERGTRTQQTSIENGKGSQKENDTGDKVLRQIQLQGMLRLLLWGRYGNRFLDLYAKSSLPKSTVTRKNKRKKRKLLENTPEHQLLEDTANILALAAFHLPPDRPFPDFVHSCLLAIPHLPPKALEYIYDKFELQKTAEQKANENALSPQKRTIKRKRSSLSSKSVSTSSTNSSSAMQSQAARQANGLILSVNCPKSGSIPGQIVTAYKDNDDEASLSLLPKRVQLTAPTTKRRNSLLGDSSSGSRFVGSHFNTSLSNMNSLFRQVKTTKRQSSNSRSSNNGGYGKAFRGKQQQQPRQQQKEQPSLTTRPNKPAAAAAAAAVERNAQQKLVRTKPPAVNKPIHQERVVVHETPCKQRAAAAAATDHQGVLLLQAQRRTSLFVAETPATPPPRTSVVLAATTRRRPFVYKNEAVVGGGANVVAQARRAIQARSERRR